MNKINLFVIFFTLFFLSSCLQTKILTGEIIDEKCLDCFVENTIEADSSLTNCEASASLYLDGKIYIASDKSIPNHSAIISYQFSDSLLKNTLAFYNNAEMKSAIKYEDFSVLPDQRTILLSTGFDRIKKDTNSWDRYNCVLYWDKDTPEKVQILAKIDNQGVGSSARLRPYFQKVFVDKNFPEGMPYFKMEGICTLPNQKLLFGVREKGAAYTDFEYVIEIITVSYFIKDGEIVLKNDFELFYRFNKKNLPFSENPALSSLEYNAQNKRLYVLTSFETDDSEKGVGGYLWYISLKDFLKKKPLKLLNDKQGNPIKFTHKAEGIAIIDNQTLMIVHDDDRRKTSINQDNTKIRKPHQAVYTIVKIK
jgi:hypothetical protein